MADAGQAEQQAEESGQPSLIAVQSPAEMKSPPPSTEKASETLLSGPNQACCSADMLDHARGSSTNDVTD